MKKIILLPLIILFSLSFMNGEERKWALEFSSGYSFGLSLDYRTSEHYWRIPPLSPEDKYYERDELSFTLRFAVKYYISKRFALQGEIEYQKQVDHSWGGSSRGYVDIKEDESFVIPYLDIIYFFKEIKRFTPYAVVGIGISHFVYNFPFPNLQVGGGFLYEIDRTFSVVLGSSLYYGRGAYFTLRFGLEVKMVE